MTEQFDPKLVEWAVRALANADKAMADMTVEELLTIALTAVADSLRAEGAAEFDSFTVNSCEQGVHADFAVDADSVQTCPFCRIDTAYQRGMVAGARQVLAEVETEAEKFDLYTNIAEKVADAAHEAVARIEGGA